MSLKEIFEKKEFIKHRNIVLDESDKKYFLERLNSGKKVYEVLPLLQVVKKIPIDLLEPILRQAIEYKDVSAPKRWMRETICRLFTPEIVQETLLEMITGDEAYRTKCKATGILYCVGGFMSAKGRGENGEINWDSGMEFIWNGERYEYKRIAGDLGHFIDRRKKFYAERIKTLTEVFVHDENLIFRYYLKRYLPSRIEEFPSDIKDQAATVLRIISSTDFPNGLDQIDKLKEAVEGDVELEKLLYDGLNWRRGRSPQ